MLYLVATPIGNLGDISLRALETLRAVDLVASEDTRKTGLLLKHFEIKKPQLAFHEHNEIQAGTKIELMLREGKSVALVTNAGTPGISDPGYTLVRRAVDAGLPCTMIPGPTGLIMALVLSGLPVHSFTFRGFAPRRPGVRRTFLAVDARSPHTLIFYESPHRLSAFLADALAVYGDRAAAVANDLTKLYESVRRGSISTLIASLEGSTPKGEYIVVIAGAEKGAAGPQNPDVGTPSPHTTGWRAPDRGADVSDEGDTYDDPDNDEPSIYAAGAHDGTSDGDADIHDEVDADDGDEPGVDAGGAPTHSNAHSHKDAPHLAPNDG